MNDLTRQSTDSSAAKIALIYAGLGENDQAIASLIETAYSERSNPSILLRPGFDPLRSVWISKTYCTVLAFRCKSGSQKSFHVRQAVCKHYLHDLSTCCRMIKRSTG